LLKWSGRNKQAERWANALSQRHFGRKCRIRYNWN
jgi:hypothetical protein